MRIVWRLWAWLGRFGRRRPVIVSQMSAVDPRRQEAIDDLPQEEIECLRKLLAKLTATKVD